MPENCKQHKWLGTQEGVTCQVCGKHLTRDEFLELINQKPAPKKGGKKKDAEL